MNLDQDADEFEHKSESKGVAADTSSYEKSDTSIEPASSSNDDNEVNQLTAKINENLISHESDEEIFGQTAEWKRKKKHIFILSSAGKPIYSRYIMTLLTLFSVQRLCNPWNKRLSL